MVVVNTGQPLRSQNRGGVECGCGGQIGIPGHPLSHSSLDLFLHQVVSAIGWWDCMVSPEPGPRAMETMG